MKFVDVSSVEDNGESTIIKPPAGGYIVKVLSVDDVPEREYLKMELEVYQGEYKGKFKFKYNQFYGEKSAKYFKRLTTALEKSNPDYKYSSNDGSTANEKEMIGKLVGVVAGDKEVMSRKGNIFTVLEVREIRSVQTILDGVEIPEMKKYEFKETSSIASQLGEVYEGWK